MGDRNKADRGALTAARDNLLATSGRWLPSMSLYALALLRDTTVMWATERAQGVVVCEAIWNNFNVNNNT